MRVIYSFVCSCLMLASPLNAEDIPELVVLTAERTIMDFGPGPEIAQGFEEHCNCRVRFVDAVKPDLTMSGLELDASETPPDVIMDLHAEQMAWALKSGKFEQHDIAVDELDLPIAWEMQEFVPYQWSALAFVYDTEVLVDPPRSLIELIESDLRISVPDPHVSPAGQAMLMWINEVYRDQGPEIWGGLSSRIDHLSPDPETGYSMIANRQVDMSFVFVGAPAFFNNGVGPGSLRSAVFDEGHYLTVHSAAVVKAGAHPELAKEFVRFLLSDEVQQSIANRGAFMPVVTPETGLPQLIRIQPKVKSHVFVHHKSSSAMCPELLENWNEVVFDALSDRLELTGRPATGGNSSARRATAACHGTGMASLQQPPE